MKTSALFCFFFTAAIAAAQGPADSLAAKADTSWKHAVILSANLTQASFTDWAQGGENSLAYGLMLSGKSTYAKDLVDWENSYKFAYGQAKLGSQGTRKTDDQIDLESVFTYKIGTFINPYASASLMTQFAKGVTYDALGNATPVSDFFDPAYLTQAAGAAYQPLPELKTRLGAALREILAKKYTNFTDDLTTTSEKEKTKIDGGIESVTELGWAVMENVVLNAKLEIFMPVQHVRQTNVRSDNTLSAKVNKFLSVNLNVQLLNDPQVQARTQIKQTLALGVNFILI